MVVVHRQHGFRFVIYVDDHEPAHVHIFGDGEMKVNLVGPDGLPDQVYNSGIKVGDRRRVMAVIRERQAEFLSAWHEIHGGK